MNIFNKVALQGLKKNRTRTLVTIVGVALSAAMITAVITFGVSLLNYLTNGAAAKYGDWHVCFYDVPSSFVQEQASSQTVSGTDVYQNIGYAALAGSQNPDKPYLFIAGFNDDTFDALPVHLISGRLPENDSELLIPTHVLANGGVSFSLGDTLSLTVGDRISQNKKLGQHDPCLLGDAKEPAGETLLPETNRTYTVVGTYTRPGFEEFSAPGYTVITKTGAMDETGDFSLFVTLKNPRTVRSYASRCAEGYAYSFNDNVLRFMGLSDDNLFNMLLLAVGGIVIAIIMTGSIFLIYNAFHISLNERTHQFGILLSVGATAKQLRHSVLFEGLCIGAIGIPLGVLFGIGGIGAVLSVVSKNFQTVIYDGVPLTLTVSLPAILAAAVVGLVTILISAYLPAKKAVGTPVMECIRQTNEVRLDAKAVKTAGFAQRIYGLEGTLALKNFKRNKNRYRSIVLSLVLSIVLFISTSAFVTSLKQLAAQTVVATSYDIGFSTQHIADREMLQLYDKLKNVDGVYDSSYQALLTAPLTVKADALTDACKTACNAVSLSPDETVSFASYIQFLDDAAYLNLVKSLGLPVENYSGENVNLIAVAKLYDENNPAKEVDEMENMFTGNSLDFSTSLQSMPQINLTFVETVPPDTPSFTGINESTPYFFWAIAPYSLLEKLSPSGTFTDTQVKGLTFRSKNPAQSTAQMALILQGETISADYSLYNVYQMLEESRSYIFIANVFAYTFILMISLIAVANVFNTISTNIKLRRRELAMLRSMGMSEHAFQKMMNFECAIYGMRALLFGLPLALLCTYLIYKSMVIGGAEGISFQLPWSSIGISVFSVFLVVFVTMLYATNKLKKENIIDALRDDMA